MPRSRLLLLFLLLTLLPPGSRAIEPAYLEQPFLNVPIADRPWAYWWWLNGNIDERTIKRDLEAMKSAGFGGLLLFDARGYHDDPNHLIVPPAKMEFMSPEWRRMVKLALTHAHRLGLEVSINLSSCAGALKGPWEVGNDAPKKLVWTTSPIFPLSSNQFTVPNPQSPIPTAPPRDKHHVSLFALRLESPPTISLAWHDAPATPRPEPPVLEAVDLSSRVDAHGRLAWVVPPGNWILLRFAWETMAGHEYDVDILDPRAVEGHFNRMGRALLQDAGPLAPKTLSHFYSVSWEGAAPTWTPALEQEFAKYRGYRLRPWLPVLAGFTIHNRADSDRFLRDYYRTLGDCFRDNFYGKLHQLSNRAGLQWHAESGGPWNRKLAAFEDADQLAFLARTDMPQGEFWFGGTSLARARGLNRPPAMTAHTYGKRLAAAEAFTHMVEHWSAYPAVLKPMADWAFCDGVNHLVWHTFTASPREFGRPGSEYFAGTHLNPNVTWFPQARPFIDYLARCQFLLRQGLFIADFCTYIGDRPYQHWGRGTNWSPRATLQLPRGYTYDLLTTEVLLDRLSVKDGRLVLPDGMSYRALVVDLDDDEAPVAALRKIADLRQAGATVILGQRKPQRAIARRTVSAAGQLADAPPGDEHLRQVADALWSNPFRADAVDRAIASLGLTPDFQGPFDYTHRRVGTTDIYFLAGNGSGDCVFRVGNRRSEFWDPVTGKRRFAGSGDGMPVNLGDNGSVFVVFRDHPTAPHSLVKEYESFDLKGPWQVRFDKQTVTFPELVAWDQHADPGIKYFSGKAVYQTSFDVSGKREGRLQLGEVRCLAEVKLNGKDLGIVWTAPWSVELRNLKPGRNRLEIAVVNTWVNRLIGDAGLPEAQRVTRSNLRLEKGPRTMKAYQGFASEDPLMRSGLLGPVKLELVKDIISQNQRAAGQK